MFYKYEVSFWFDGCLSDDCGIVFGHSITEVAEHLGQWYGKDVIANLAIDAIDLDISVPVLPFNGQLALVNQVVEVMEL